MCLIITTKNQSGGIYNNYSTGGQGFMAVVNKPCPQAYALGLGLFTAISPWHCAIIITKDILGMKPLPSFVRWMCVIMVAVPFMVTSLNKRHCAYGQVTYFLKFVSEILT